MTLGGVIGGAVASAVLLLVVGILGLPAAAAVAGAITSVLALAMLARTGLPSKTGRRSVRWVAAAVGAAPVAFALLVEVAGVDLVVEGTLWPWRALAGVAAIVAATAFVSSLIDWCYVLPALRGDRGQLSMPCRSSTNAAWRKVTRRWLAHRIAVYLVIRLAVVAALGLIAAAVLVYLKVRISQPAGTVLGAVLGTGGAATLVFFLNRFVPVMTLVSNPPLQVGDKVVLAEEYGAGVKERPVYYVVDVAIEGVQLRQLDKEGRPLGGVPRTHDRSLSLVDVPRLLRFRDQFTGCDRTCSKANRYCGLAHHQPVESPET